VTEDGKIPSVYDHEADAKRHRRWWRRRGPIFGAVIAGVILLPIATIYGHIGAIPRVYDDVESFVTGNPNIPPPNLGRIVTQQSRILYHQQFVLDTKIDPVEVVATTSGPLAGIKGSGDVLLLSWDPNLGRWTTIFDAAKSEIGSSLNYQPFRGTRPSSVDAVPVSSGVPGQRDLAVSAILSGLAGPPSQFVIVVGYQNQAAQINYSFLSPGPGFISPVLVGNQTNLRITATLYSPTDCLLCSVRNFSFELAPGPYSIFSPIADDRPWAGSFVVDDTLDPGNGWKVVAANKSSGFQIGDQLIAVSTAGSKPSGTANPSVFDYLESHRAGDRVEISVVRKGEPLGWNTNLSSLLLLENHLPEQNKIGITIPKTVGAQFGTAIAGTTPPGVLPGVYMTELSTGSLSRLWSDGIKTVSRSPWEVRVLSINGIAPADAFAAYQDISDSSGTINLDLSVFGTQMSFNDVECAPVETSVFGVGTQILPVGPVPF
jgi:hypothetical protein